MPLQQTSGNDTSDAYGGGAAIVPNYIEDVFSTYLYAGNDTTNNIVNGVDLSTYGGLVWLKSRSSATSNFLVDTVRGRQYYLYSNETLAQQGPSAAGRDLSTFNTNGFTLGQGAYSDTNYTGTNYVSWTFRKQPKFFDIVTYTGNGTTQTISHNLGSAPGCVIVKCTSASTNWIVYHSDLGNSSGVSLNTTNANGSWSGSSYYNNTTPSASSFSVGNNTWTNGSGSTYVAYLFASNAGGFGAAGTDNVITCGSFTSNGSGSANVTLGYEPQWVLIKGITVGESWYVTDTMRGMPVTPATNSPYLRPNSSAAENSWGSVNGVNATGWNTTGLAASTTYIYIAIRHGPMKTPTDATTVFAPVAQFTTGGYPRPVVTNFPVDLAILGDRGGWGYNLTAQDRLRGGKSALFTSDVVAENTGALSSFAYNTQFGDGWVSGGSNAIYECFQRAPGFFDVVCFTTTDGTYSGNHNLGVIPELLIFKSRNGSGDWQTVSSYLTSAAYFVRLNSTMAQYNNTNTNYTATSTTFSIPNAGFINFSATMVAYLFATCAGVSKVGTYTGNGTTQTINCGFTGGARFVLIKRTDSTGDWYVYDTARGMTTLTDPYLLLNSTAAETATLGSVTTVTTGFALNSTILAAINASGGTYIFLAIA